MKNVAGYDLMKLLIGSYGTLAVITSASFKLFPAPRQTCTFLAEFASAKEALEFRDLVMRSPLSPMCLEIVSPGARQAMRPEMTSDSWVICVRAAGSDAVLARYRKELGSAVSRELLGDGERKMWRAIADFPLGANTPAESATGPVCNHCYQINLPPQDLLGAVEAVTAVASIGESEVGMIGRVGVGHLLVAVSGSEPNGDIAVNAVLNALRSRFNGVTVKADGMANPWPIPPTNLKSMRAVKHALDPNDVLRARKVF